MCPSQVLHLFVGRDEVSEAIVSSCCPWQHTQHLLGGIYSAPQAEQAEMPTPW